MGEPRLASNRAWAIVFLLVSVVLLASGVWIVATDAGEATETYYRVNVSAGSGTIEMSAEKRVRPPQEITGIDCYRSEGRSCGLELLLLRGNESSALLPEFVSRGPGDFVRLGDRFYRRTRTEHNATHDRLGLEAVPAVTVLRNVSVPVAGTARTEREIVTSGSARVPADRRVATELLFDTGDGYAMVAEVPSEGTAGWPPVEYPLLVAGLGCFAVAGRYAVRARSGSFSPPKRP
jgi:hypothetical protein